MASLCMSSYSSVDRAPAPGVRKIIMFMVIGSIPVGDFFFFSLSYAGLSRVRRFTFHIS